jgi:anti-sigma B factor antagonist
VTTQLAIETDKDGGICVVRISGTLRSGSDDVYVLEKSQEIKAMGCIRLILDIRELHSTGSSGIGLFVGLFTSLTRAGGRMVLAGPSKVVREVLDLTRLSTVIPVLDDLAAARAFLTS